MPMLPLFTDAPVGTDHSRTIADVVGISDNTAFVGAVNYAYTLRDSVGISDATAQAVVVFLPAKPIMINQAALVRAHNW